MTDIATPADPSAETALSIDPRPLFAEAVRIGRHVVAGIRADQFEAPTPCDLFDVRALAGHLVAVLHRVAVVGGGGDPFTAAEVTTGVADDGWAAAYDARAAEVAEVWADDAVLTNVLTLPWTQLPGAIALMIYVSEVTVHTWDLAVATGQQPAWDPAVIAGAFTAMQRGLPDDGRMERFAEAGADIDGSGNGFPPPFRRAVQVADDAAPIDNLVAWCGRNPAGAR